MLNDLIMQASCLDSGSVWYPIFRANFDCGRVFSGFRFNLELLILLILLILMGIIATILILWKRGLLAKYIHDIAKNGKSWAFRY